MQRLNEEIRSTKWLKSLDARWRPAWAKSVQAEITSEDAGQTDLGPKDPYAEHLGVRFTRIGADGSVLAELAVVTRHLNHEGSVHPGVLFTLAEAVLNKACNSHGVSAQVLDVTASFIASAKSGDTIKAQADEVVLRRRTAVYTVTLRNQHEETIAIFQGTAIRMA